MTGTSLYPIAGTVTIDGVPPTFDEQRKHLVLMLYDPKKPDLPVGKRPHCLAREDGTFRFTEDGIEPGHYVLLFAVLRRKGQGNFIGPDQLNNLYNDPDVNAKNPRSSLSTTRRREKRLPIQSGIRGEAAGQRARPPRHDQYVVKGKSLRRARAVEGATSKRPP